MLRFAIQDLLWLMVVVAITWQWWFAVVRNRNLQRQAEATQDDMRRQLWLDEHYVKLWQERRRNDDDRRHADQAAFGARWPNVAQRSTRRDGPLNERNNGGIVHPVGG